MNRKRLLFCGAALWVLLLLAGSIYFLYDFISNRQEPEVHAVYHDEGVSRLYANGDMRLTFDLTQEEENRNYVNSYMQLYADGAFTIQFPPVHFMGHGRKGLLSFDGDDFFGYHSMVSLAPDGGVLIMQMMHDENWVADAIRMVVIPRDRDPYLVYDEDEFENEMEKMLGQK